MPRTLAWRFSAARPDSSISFSNALTMSAIGTTCAVMPCLRTSSSASASEWSEE